MPYQRRTSDAVPGKPSAWRAGLFVLALGLGATRAMADPFGLPDTDTLLPRGLGAPIATGAALSPVLPTIAPTTAGGKEQAPVSFEADKAEYDDQTEILTATGNVFLQRQDQSVVADKVTYNRNTGQIVATGKVRVVDKDGNQIFTNHVELTDSFDVGTMENFLMALREGGRLAAVEGARDAEGRVILKRAAYTGCAVVNTRGCDVQPSWRIDAERVVYNPHRRLMRFYGARLIIFGLHLPKSPATISIATDGRALAGLLIPNFRVSAANGIEYDQPYYQRLGANSDITATAYLFSKVAPMGEVQYRDLTSLGAFQITAYATSSPRIPVGAITASPNARTSFRGYLDTNGSFQLSPGWTLDFSGRLTTDRTFLQRYYISGDDTLRSTASLSHIDTDSYFSITGWAFETLRPDERQGLVPLALPEIDYRRRIADPLLGGVIELQANSLAITRSAGEDMQRAFASAQWQLRQITSLGQVITFTGLLRGDVYHSTNNDLNPVTVYQGLPGWQARGVATGAVDVTWPLVGALFGGTQVFTPHIQFVATPPVRNLAIPNEDSRAVELEDDNLFALNRFPGYDRVEDGAHVTYGIDWQLERPGLSANGTVGQSYRLTNDVTLLPNGTGLYDRLSDIVGRIEVRYHDLLSLTERFRIDKSSYVFHRNEFDATIGSDKSYIEVGYLRLNRQTALTLEDLQDANELRLAGRVAMGPYWSAFGSGIFDLSQASLLPNQTPTTIQPLRTRAGISYQSDCLELDITWRRDFITIGDAVRGNSFLIHLSLKNLGMRGR
ncbi:MAG: LPS-assembly protein LptD [Sphingomonadales bacterium]|nr:LPS-assembly protein LptD [Sphingomonadales bacterium]